jgi:hypothetical protein
LDEAAITAAAEVFPAEFNPTGYHYGSQNGSVQALFDAIEKID